MRDAAPAHAQRNAGERRFSKPQDLVRPPASALSDLAGGSRGECRTARLPTVVTCSARASAASCRARARPCAPPSRRAARRSAACTRSSGVVLARVATPMLRGHSARSRCRAGRRSRLPAKPLGRSGSLPLVRVRQEDEERLTPSPVDVLASHRFAHAVGDGPQDPVAGPVAVRVVGLLEAVEVDHQDRHRPTGPAGPRRSPARYWSGPDRLARPVSASVRALLAIHSESAVSLAEHAPGAPSRTRSRSRNEPRQRLCPAVGRSEQELFGTSITTRQEVPGTSVTLKVLGVLAPRTAPSEECPIDLTSAGSSSMQTAHCRPRARGDDVPGSVDEVRLVGPVGDHVVDEGAEGESGGSDRRCWNPPSARRRERHGDGYDGLAPDG